MNFIDQCLSGEVLLDEIEDFIDKWHEGEEGEALELHEYLGMSWEEYELWGTMPSVLSFIIAARRNKSTLDVELERERYALAARASSPEEAKRVEVWLRKIGKIK